MFIEVFDKKKNWFPKCFHLRYYLNAAYFFLLQKNVLVEMWDFFGRTLVWQTVSLIKVTWNLINKQYPELKLTGTFPLNSIFTSSCLMAASLSWSISRSTSSSICRTCRVWENLKINSNVWSQSTDIKAMYCILIYSWNTTEGELWLAGCEPYPGVIFRSSLPVSSSKGDCK